MCPIPEPIGPARARFQPNYSVLDDMTRSRAVAGRIGKSETRLATRIGDSIEAYPLFWIVASLLVSGAVEVAQAWPEIVPFAHAAGEVVRNLGYAVTAGVLFHWLLVSLPVRQEKLHLYRAKHGLLVQVVGWGPRLLGVVSELTGTPVAALPRTVDGLGDALGAVPVGEVLSKSSVLDVYGDRPINLRRLLWFSATGPISDGLEPFLDRFDAPIANALVDFSNACNEVFSLAYRKDKDDLRFAAKAVLGVASASDALRSHLEEMAPEIDWAPPKEAED